MSRLTKWNGKKWILPQGRWREVAERLAAYENTGLEPEQILINGERPRGYTLSVVDGECLHRELWFGTSKEIGAHILFLYDEAKRWGWDSATVYAEEWKKGE